MRAILLLTTAVLIAGPALAEDQSAPAQEDTAKHGGIEPEIVVTAPFGRTRTDALSTLDVVSGVELARDLRSSIGDTLARQPGVSATSYSPAASRPILRGQQGDRVRVLTDGIGSIDVSTSSVDHAVAINPLLADRIEVLRGPGAILYGSNAVGGVVNVIDRRIPRSVPSEAVHFDGRAGYGSAADEVSGGGVIDLPLGSGFVAHADGSYLKADDLGIGGYVLSRPLREAAAAAGQTDLAGLKDKLPNSDVRFFDYAGSLAWIGDNANLGVAVSQFRNTYGIPVRYPVGDPEGEAEVVELAQKQTRVDARGEVDLGGFLKSARFRFGWADYTHSEIAREDGAVNTTFDTTGYEGRVEAEQNRIGVWRAFHGVQFSHRNLDVVGAEAFLPPSQTGNIGLFTLHEFDLGKVTAEAGLRYDNQKVTSDAVDFERSFDAVSISLGAAYRLNDAWRVGLNLSRTERAPTADELLANGPHAGTQAFEIGDPGFTTEKARSAELYVRGGDRRASFEAAVYYTSYKDYIEQFPTGAVEDDLPVFLYRQASANFWGFEVQGQAVFATIGGFDLAADALIDYVRGEIDSAGPPPRIPPLRVLGGVEVRGEGFTGRIEAEHVTKQDRIADFETPTDGYTLVNASLSWSPLGSGNATSLTLSGNNLGDVSARRHASFLKDYAPLAGRDVRLTIRLSY